MSTGWIVFILSLVFVLGGLLPLLGKRGSGPAPLPPRKETLKDWRGDK